jgi:predicted Zn-dependent protease with MMP-like domain
MSEADIVESIYDALDADQPERALALAREGLGHDEDPVLRFLAGVALSEMGQAREAVAEFSKSVEIDADDPEYRSHLARALFRDGRYDKADEEARRVLEADARFSDAISTRALVLERRGQLDDAERLFREAHEIDPERFPRPVRLGRAEFENEIKQAAELLPESFRTRLAEVTTFVEDLPTDAILNESDPPLDPELLGLFVGVALPDRTHFSTGGDLPPRILLFQRNLERYATTLDELREEIAITLYHELGHYLGLDEEELEELDLA